MKLKLLSTLGILLLAVCIHAQNSFDKNTYYRTINGKSGRALKSALFQVIKNPSVIDYDSLWKAYDTSDIRVLDQKTIIWDMYSDISRYPQYDYPHGTGAGNTEGVKGIQREHSMPKAWFNPVARTSSKASKNYEDIHPLYSDIVHLIPTDAVCNNNRSDLCYGEIADGQVEWSSGNDFSKKSKLGGCSTPGWKEQVSDPTKKRVFEPNDENKGDLARIYFYMATCYEPGYFAWIPIRHTEIKTDNKGVEYESYVKDGEEGALSANHCGTWTSDMFKTGDTEEDQDFYQPFAPWAFDMLMRWSKEDPVSEKEMARNEAIWRFQGNRNPFVDYPGLENFVWGDQQTVPFGGDEVAEIPSNNIQVVLNKNTFNVDWSATGDFRDYWTRTPLVYDQEGVTITYNFGMEGRYLYADDTKIRLYNYNTLTVKSHQTELTKIEFTLGESLEDKKALVSSVGEVTGNVWQGSAEEVIFASSYVSSVKTGNNSKHYYLDLSNIKVTVANPTGITERQAPRQEDSRVFNLMGFQVNPQSAVPGIYVRNGQKYIRR